MNANYFVFIAALLSFATGFLVAAIIWIIKWFLLAKEERVTDKSVHLLHIFAKRSQLSTSVISSTMLNNDSANKELYQYYHGKN